MDWESDEFDSLVKELVFLAGSFNHNITRAHRDQLVDFIASLGDWALDPVLEALTVVPRVEQFDLTKTIIRRMIKRSNEE